MSIKNSARVLGLAAAIVVGSVLPALAVDAFAATNLNVRSCGSTDCRVVDVLRRGERVDVQYCQYSWCAIEKRGRDGWVNANYLSRDGYDDDYYDDDEDDYFYIEPRRHPRRHNRFYDSGFGACVGGPNARLCVFD
jgi:uncharacterized protein YraI